MVSLNITIRQSKKRGKKAVIEFNADKFERLAAAFGFFNPQFLKDLEESEEESEKDYKEGRFRKINSLKDLR